MHRRWIPLGALALILAGGRAADAQAPATLAPALAAPSDTLLLSLSDAHRYALEQNPAFLADRQESAIARSQLRKARVHLNPSLEFQAPGAGTDGALSEFEAELSQELEWAGQRRLRIRAARAGVDRAGSAVHDAARRMLAKVSAAYYTALAAEKRLLVARELSELNQQLLAATRIQAKEGEISAMEANLVEIEAGRARARVAAAEREATHTRLEVQRLTGTAPDLEIRLQDAVPPAPDPATIEPDTLVCLALARRPDIAAQSHAVDEYEELARLARREAIPNLRLGVFLRRETLAVHSTGMEAPVGERVLDSPHIGIGLGIPVPIFDRNQGAIAERSAQVEQARYERQATELAVRTEVTDAVRAYRAASEEASLFEREVLQPARNNQLLLESAYRAGKIDLANLILLRNQLLDVELGYWDAWLAQREALVDLEAATAALQLSGDSPYLMDEWN